MKKITLKVPKQSKRTVIKFGEEFALSKALTQWLEKHPQKTALICDQNVEKLYGKSLEHLDLKVFSFPEGEGAKTRETKAMLEDLLLSHQFGRDSLLIGLGGGVVGDLVGFLASTYCRGVPFILIPTTLLAMVDASLGGKTGVNTAYGKNLIGSFYHPEEIWIDTHFLKTLDPQEKMNGVAEIIKYGLISSKSLFQQMLKKQADFIPEAILESVSIKAKIVESDPYEEKGMRRILNFGHTLGHALETLEDYALPHGQAIAMGMITASYISQKLGFLPEEEFKEIYAIFKAYGFSLKLSKQHSIDDLMATLALDKKSRKSSPRFVLLKGIGEPHPFEGEYCTEIDFDLLEKSLIWMNHEFSLHPSL